MPERAHPNDPIWQSQFLFSPTPALAYLRQRYRFCRPYTRNRLVLDVPCGTGMGAPYLKNANLLVGLDRDSSAVEFAVTRYGQFYDSAVPGSMVALPFAPNSFDVVVCLEGIEHIMRDDGIIFLNEAARILVNEGILLLSCPLSINGGHSGNDYHLYEWSQDELMQEVERGFFIIKQKLIDGPASKVLLIAAKRKNDVPIYESRNMTRFVSGIDRVTAWVSSQWFGAQARYAVTEEPELLPTCFAVLAEETLGSLDQWDDSQRQQVAEGLLDEQDPETGLFALDDIKDQDLLWPNGCDLQYVRYQVTYFALSALSALNVKSRYPLKFAKKWLNTDYALGWIEGGPWRDPWNHSNRIMFLLRSLIHLGMDWGYEQAWSCYDTVIDYLLQQQNPETGLWHGFANCDVRTAVYAAYHFFPFMFWRGILPPYADRIIDSTLSIQSSEGLFGSQIGGGACEDLDAIDILVKFSLLTSHRAEDIKTALVRAFDRILQIQNSDGGFPNYLSRSLPYDGKSLKRRIGEKLGLDVLLNKPYRGTKMSYYSGWKRVKATKGTSDMWAGWFRPLALSLIVSRYPELGNLSVDSRFHTLPALGWHDTHKIQSAKPIGSPLY